MSEPKLERRTSLTPHVSQATHVRSQDTAATDRWRKGRRGAPAGVAQWEMPEPVRKARQARPLSPPQASRPSGLFKHIDPVSVAISIRPRARPISRDFVAQCAGWLGARGTKQSAVTRVGGGLGSKCRQGKRATDLFCICHMQICTRVLGLHHVARCLAARTSPCEGGGMFAGEPATMQYAAPL